MKETEKAYLAGLIDADGSITFSAKDHGRGIRAQALIIVVNSNYEIIEYLKETTGYGCAYETKAKPTRPDQDQSNWNKVHRFQVTGKNALDLCRKIYPYLRIKKAQADLLLQYSVRGVDFKQQRTDEQKAKDARLVTEMRTLNQRKAA